MEEILKNNFEISYQEFKEYEQFLKNAAPKIKKEREEFTQFTIDNSSNTEAITDKLFEIETTPVNYQNDLLKLQNKLITTYHTVKDCIEIPAEIKKEVESLISPKQIYKIKNGEAQEIDPSYTEKIKVESKKYYKQMLEQMNKG